MASGNECAEATQVLLVDSQSLPVLLQDDSEENPGGISVDLLQQALQGASAIEEDGDGESGEEVSLDALAGGNNDVVAIYQGEEGQTHTIKISLAEAQSLGLNFSNNSIPLSLDDSSVVDGMKVTSVGDNLSADSSVNLSSTNLLQSISCSNVGTEGRIIDEEGNIVETAEALQILPSSLSSFLEDGINQSLSIVPQYELDGTVTYAVKLKDQTDAAVGSDYHVLEPNSSAKTGLDIEEELKSSSMKHNILHPGNALSTESIGLSSSISLNGESNPTSTIQVPISTLEALSKQMLLPVSNSSVPISVTLSIPTGVSVPSLSSSVPSSSNIATTNSGRIFQIVTDHNSMGINNMISTDSGAVPLTSIVSQPTLTINQQHPQLLNPTTSLLNVQTAPGVTLLGSTRSVSQHNLRKQTFSERLTPILPAPKNLSSTPLKSIPALKKLPSLSLNAVTPATLVPTSMQTPLSGAIAPSTTQTTFSTSSVTKTAPSAARLTSSNANSSKPLGSSENPIQLVQQGQTFHSMQALSQAQLRQIATVLQQKHLNSNSAATKNVLFDEQTKTRIVYRVVYPEDVDLQQPPSSPTKGASSTSQSDKLSNRFKGRRGRSKKGKRRASGIEKISHKTDIPTTLNDLGVNGKRNESREDGGSVEETPKVERKKILGSRTRSGRVSRPPKHMIKDYKHLHHTDYKEHDIDDSDGGYSDYSNPERPPEKVPVKEIEIDASPVKKKFSRFTCPTCNKLYLGLGRMEKHFNQHPDHGSFEEFKQQLSAATTSETNPEGDKTLTSKANLVRGKKRSQGTAQSEKDRSDIRKKKLQQALQACEISEILEVAGPLIARYYSLWDLLVLRLMARGESSRAKEAVEDVSQDNLPAGKEDPLDSLDLVSSQNRAHFGVGTYSDENQRRHSTSNRVQWLLMEISSLSDMLHSVAGELFQPALLHEDEKSQIEISQKPLSEMLGVSCGMYCVNEERLWEKMESDLSASKLKFVEKTDPPVEKRSRTENEGQEIDLNLTSKDSEMCSEGLSSLSLMVKPVEEDKAMLAKLTEDMPFLNSSGEIICGSEDQDLSTDSKQNHDCDPSAGLQVVDDIVNERLTNLSENMNFSVPIQNGLQTSDINGEQSDLHLISSFGEAEASISVSDSSVIPNDLSSNKPSVSVPTMDLMSSYSISSLSHPGAHDVNISNSEPSNELTTDLEPVTSQSMLSTFGMGLSSLSSFDALPSQSSSVPHSEDSFLDSLSSFETPLTQSCSSSTAPPSFEDSVMKGNSILQLPNEPSDSPRLPPKFIASFTPAITNDKSESSISTAQRLQRSYLELESGLDDGLDIDFDAFTHELSMNRNSSA